MKARKILSMALALAMTLGMSLQAFAAEATDSVDETVVDEAATDEAATDETAGVDVVGMEPPAEGEGVIDGAAADDTTAVAAPDFAEGDIAIVYTNDIHCGVIPVVNEEDGTVTNIGYAGVAGFVDSVEAVVGEANVTLVDAGDAVQGDAIGTLSVGQYLVDIINEMGYDIFVPGNHEFDYGMEQMQALMAQINGEVISSNFIDLETDKPVFEGYTVVTYGDVKVAYVGITTPESFTKSTPKYFQDAEGNYIYGLSEGNDGADLYAAVQANVDAAVAEGAEYVIAVGHLGVDEISAPWRSTDVIANTTGIDAFIDGHSHTVMEGKLVSNLDGEEVLLTQTGTKLANVGLLTISADGTISSSLYSGLTEVNEEIDAFVSGKMAEHEVALAEVVGSTDVTLAINDPAAEEETRIVRSQETNLGDLDADAYRYVLGNGAGEPADIGFANGGGIRVEIPAGEITFGNVISVHPYNNVGMVVEATGQEIVDALEMAVRALPGENGGFLHVSGMTYAVDASIETTVEESDQSEFIAVNGARRVSDVMVGEEPIDLEATYTVASHNYMLMNGGDGINMFMDNEIVVQPVMLDNQILISYIQDNLGGVVGEEYSDPYGQGRITITLAEEAAAEEPVAEEPATEAPAVEEPATEEPATEEPAAVPAEPEVSVPGFEVPVPFTDVPVGAQYFEYVMAVYEAGLVSGTGEGLYSPDMTMTNAMALTLLYNHAGKPAVEASADPLDEWASAISGEWYADAAYWANEAGILSAEAAADFGAEMSNEDFNALLSAYADSANLEFSPTLFDSGAFTRGDAAILMSDFLEQAA